MAKPRFVIGQTDQPGFARMPAGQVKAATLAARLPA
jgi:hypothetical protein